MALAEYILVGIKGGKLGSHLIVEPTEVPYIIVDIAVV